MNLTLEQQVQAKALYKPPFRYEHRYVWDADDHMVADFRGHRFKGVRNFRVRGWGRLQYFPDGEALHDRMGQLFEALVPETDPTPDTVINALNAFWTNPFSEEDKQT